MADKSVSRISLKFPDSSDIAVFDPAIIASEAIKGEVPDGSSTVGGKVRLSDEINSSSDALNGKTASTPKAVKTVNDKVGDTSQLKTKNKTSLVEAVNSLHTTLFPSGSEEGSDGIANVAYVNKANTFDKNQTLSAGINITGGKAYAPTPDFASAEPNEIVTMEIAKKIQDGKVPAYIQAPTLTVTGQPDNVLEQPYLKGGAFSVSGGSDTHEKTDWQIIKKTDSSVVWQELNSTSNKTSIKVPKGRLQVSTDYIAKVRYNGARYSWSAYTETPFKTKAKFVYVETPIITIKGGNTDVTPNSVITGSEFKLVE